MFPAQLSGLVICARGVIRNLMVAAVSKPSIQSIIPQKRTSYPYTSTERAPRLILAENSFQFNGKKLPKIHGTAMYTKMVVAFANIFMAKGETEILNQSGLTDHSSGNDSLTTSSPSGAQPEKRSDSS